jgi:hypothetical protein
VLNTPGLLLKKSIKFAGDKSKNLEAQRRSQNSFIWDLVIPTRSTSPTSAGHLPFNLPHASLLPPLTSATSDNVASYLFYHHIKASVACALGTSGVKCAATQTPKTANFKKFLPLFSHRVTRIGYRESKTFFSINAQVRPTKGNVYYIRRIYNGYWFSGNNNYSFTHIPIYSFTFLCETNPISQKQKMNSNPYTTKNYNNKSGLLTIPKQTQSNPILSKVSAAAFLNHNSFKAILSQSTR